jgi:hypothetical protein
MGGVALVATGLLCAFAGLDRASTLPHGFEASEASQGT